MRLTKKMIRDKAYQLWEADGRPMGTADEHWFAAEALLSEAGDTTLDKSRKDEKHALPIGLRQLSDP
jgi:hypothetical protein